MLGCHDNFGKIFYLPIFFRKTFEFPFHNPCYWLLLEYIWRYIRIKFLNLNTVKWLFISIGSTLVLVALTYFFVQRKAIPFRFVKTYLFIVNHLFLQVAFNYRKSLVFGIYTRKQTGQKNTKCGRKCKTINLRILKKAVIMFTRKIFPSMLIEFLMALIAIHNIARTANEKAA